ncbi:effector-associated constant component EACC1 [Sorangium sp. So ce1000]|uniref:effector-associated constant component EACC1 n=1 Tax=Sorangium sp. So ce1000 TaxID=3133325 RepID=UPI003F5D9D5F
MTETVFELKFEGEGASDAAWEFAEHLKRRAGVRPEVRRGAAAPGQPTRGADLGLLVDVLALVLSVPGAILSADQLLTWLKKRRGAAHAAPEASPTLTISLHGAGADGPLSKEDMKALLDLLERAARGGDAEQSGAREQTREQR